MILFAFHVTKLFDFFVFFRMREVCFCSFDMINNSVPRRIESLGNFSFSFNGFWWAEWNLKRTESEDSKERCIKSLLPNA